MGKKRSVGVMVFGIILIIVSIWAVMTGILLCKGTIRNYLAPIPKNMENNPFLTLFFSKPKIKDVVCAFVGLIFAFLFICSGIGILKLLNNIRIQFLVIATAYLTFGLYVTFEYISLFLLLYFWQVMPFYIIAVLDILGLVLLTRPKVKEQFK